MAKKINRKHSTTRKKALDNDSRMRTRPELMNKLNELLNTEYNWRRLSHLDLKRLVESLEVNEDEKGHNQGKHP